MNFRKHHTPMRDFPAPSMSDNLIGDTGYTWLPAGFIASSAFRFVGLIKYQPLSRTHFDHTKFIEVGDNIWDVTLHLPNKTLRLLPFQVPFDPSQYDEVIYFDPFDPRSRICDELDWILGSAHYAMDKLDFPWGRQADLKIVMDSGGAQLKLGTADFVDPHEVIRAMNASANAGFALDVPPRINVDIKNAAMLDTLALLQKKNNEIFLGERRDDLALLNILHGTSVDEHRRWFDKVYADGFQGYALGIDDTTDPLCGVRGAIMLHENLKGEDFWLHMFGVSGPKMIPALAWFGRVHGRVSSDSSTWFEGARRAKYFHHDRHANMDGLRLSTQMIDEGGPLYMLRDSKTDSGYENLTWSPGGMLPCPCQICNTLGSIDAMVGHYYDSSLITLHDLVAMRRFGHQWNTLAHTLPIDEYLSLTRQIMGPRSAEMVEYIAIGLEHGLDAAERAFRGGPNKTHSTKTNSLVANNTDGRKLPLFLAKRQAEEAAADAKAAEREAEEAKAEQEEELEMEQAINEQAEADAAVDSEVAEAASDEAVDETRYYGRRTIYHSEVLLDKGSETSGVVPDLEFYASIDDVPKDVPEPKGGWPLTNHVAKFSTAWAPTETTKYQTTWRKDTPYRIVWPPKVPEWATVPDTITLTFPEGSNMECLLNYIDVNNKDHIAELTAIDPNLTDWLFYSLHHEPELFRMMELADAEVKKKRNRVEKERIIHDYYVDIRQKMDAGQYDQISYYIENEHIKKRETKVQGQKEARVRRDARKAGANA